MKRSGALLVLVAAAHVFGAASRGLADETLTFSHTRGFYGAPFDLVLTSAVEGATVRYTLDCDEPGPYRGEIYRAPLRIATTTVVRAMAIAESGQAYVGVTHTYVFPAHVARQPAYPPGYPRTFVSKRKGPGRPHDFDWAMDPEVLGDPRSGNLASHLLELPTLALSLPVGDLSYLYAYHQARGVAYERAASAELLYPPRPEYGGFEGFQINCGIRMQGGLAVDQARKKSFRLLFKKRYGPGKLRYPLFESAVHHAASAATRFDTVVLRAGGNTNWSKDDAHKHAPSTYLRDQLVRDSQLAASGIGAHGVFVHLYLNGLYFGLYNIAERPDAKFLATYLGGEEEDYYSVNHDGTVAGEPGRFGDMLGLANVGGHPGGGLRRGGQRSGELWDPARELIDIAGFCDSIALHWLLGVGDWPWNNWYAGVDNARAGPVRFLAWDAELALWTDPDYHSSNPGAWVNPLFHSSSYLAPRLWRTLAAHPDFRMAFADRVARHCGSGGAYSDAAMRARFTALAARIENAIVAESARWGDAAWGQEDAPRTRHGDWIPNRDAILRLIDGNAARFIAALRAEGLYPSLEAPRVTRPLAPFRRGLAVAVTNASDRGEIVVSLDGSDPRPPGGGEPAETTLRLVDRVTTLTLDRTARLRARARDRGEWGPLADELILVEHATLPLRFAEVMYHPDGDEALEFIELRNVGAAPLDLTGLRLEGVDYRFAPGAELDGGTAVLLIPDDDPKAFRERYPTAEIWGTYRGHLANGGEALRLVDAEGRVVDSAEFDDADGWPELADGDGHSLEAVALGADGVATGAARWRASSSPGGTPGR